MSRSEQPSETDIDRGWNSWLRRQQRGGGGSTWREIRTSDTKKVGEKLSNSDSNSRSERAVATELTRPDADSNPQKNDNRSPQPAERSRTRGTLWAPENNDQHRVFDDSNNNNASTDSRPRVSITRSASVPQSSRRVADASAPPPEDDDVTKTISQPITRPISQEQLVAEVKGIYAGLVMIESKCVEVDNSQNASGSSDKLSDEQWGALIALHRTLLREHHDFFLASQHLSASPALKRLARKDVMRCTMMWRHGIYSFLKRLNHRPPASLEHMLAFIYLAYSMMALVYDTTTAFEDTWIECLGNPGRYRMSEPPWYPNISDNGWLVLSSVRGHSHATRKLDDARGCGDYPVLQATLNMMLPSLLQVAEPQVALKDPSVLPDLYWDYTMQAIRVGDTLCIEPAWPCHRGSEPGQAHCWAPWQPGNGTESHSPARQKTNSVLLVRLIVIAMFLTFANAADGIPRIPAFLTVALAMIATGAGTVSYEMAGKPMWSESFVMSLAASAVVAEVGFFSCYVAFYLPSAKKRAMFFQAFGASLGGLKIAAMAASSNANAGTPEKGIVELILLVLLSTASAICAVESKVWLVSVKDNGEGGADQDRGNQDGERGGERSHSSIA